MALEITVKNSGEFEELMMGQDLDTSKSLVETILKNLKGKRRHIHALSVNVLEDSSIFCKPNIIIYMRFKSTDKG